MTIDRRRRPRSRRLAPTVLAVTVASLTVAAGACSSDDGGPGFEVSEVGEATYAYTIPAGAGEALDRGEPLEIVPGTLEANVGETIEIRNLDDRGHNVGPWFVGAGETLRQTFTSPGEFEGACTVHPSGELILRIRA